MIYLFPIISFSIFSFSHHPMLSIQHAVFSTQRPEFSIQYHHPDAASGIQHAAFSIQHSASSMAASSIPHPVSSRRFGSDSAQTVCAALCQKMEPLLKRAKIPPRTAQTDPTCTCVRCGQAVAHVGTKPALQTVGF